jgi:membrane-bound metal-dependent hydrolase YbcI (DUF457 family)
MVAGRLHSESTGRSAFLSVLVFGTLAMLPDFDVIALSLGVPDVGLWGHRGISHSPLAALAVGLVVTILAWGRDRHPLRLGLAVALVVGSHCVLDALAQDGRGMLFLWPFSLQRFHFQWRPIPDAPRGLAYFTGVGLRHFVIELLYFLPFTGYALRPRRRAGAAARARTAAAR